MMEYWNNEMLVISRLMGNLNFLNIFNMRECMKTVLRPMRAARLLVGLRFIQSTPARVFFLPSLKPITR